MKGRRQGSTPRQAMARSADGIRPSAPSRSSRCWRSAPKVDPLGWVIGSGHHGTSPAVLKLASPPWISTLPSASTRA